MMDIPNSDWAIFDRKISRFGGTWGISMKTVLKDMGFQPGDAVTVAILKRGKKLVIRYDYEIVDEISED